MGCEQSRLALLHHGPDHHKDVSRSRKRKRIIRDAVKFRSDFSLAHAAYVHSLASLAESLSRFTASAEIATASGLKGGTDLPASDSSSATVEDAAADSHASLEGQPLMSAGGEQEQGDIGAVVLKPAVGELSAASKPATPIDIAAIANKSVNEQQQQSLPTQSNHIDMSPLRSKFDNSSTIIVPAATHLSAAAGVASSTDIAYNSRSFPDSPFGSRYLSSDDGIKLSSSPMPSYTNPSYSDLPPSVTGSPLSSSAHWDPFHLFRHSPIRSRTQEQILAEMQSLDWEQYQMQADLAKEEGMPDLEEFVIFPKSELLQQNHSHEESDRSRSVAAPLQKRTESTGVDGFGANYVVDPETVTEESDNHRNPADASVQLLPPKKVVDEATSPTAGQEDISDDKAHHSLTALNAAGVDQLASDSSRKQSVDWSDNSSASKQQTLKEVMKKVTDRFIAASLSGTGVSELLEVMHHGRMLEQLPASAGGLSYFRSESFRFTETIKRRLGRRKDRAASAAAEWESFVVDDDAVMNDMGGGRSHSMTLETLYAWEKKLYKEVKVWDNLRVALARRSRQLSIMEAAKTEDDMLVAQAREEVEELHSQLSVTFDAISSSSANIEKITTNELYPQLEDLLQRLMEMWKGMGECHSEQRAMAEQQLQSIITGSKGGGGTRAMNDYSKVKAMESHRNATIQLERELRKWSYNLTMWLKTQQKYVDAMVGWIRVCHILEPAIATKLGSISPLGSGRTTPSSSATPIFALCRYWQVSISAMAVPPLSRTTVSITRFADALHSLQLAEADELRHRHHMMQLSSSAPTNHHKLMEQEPRSLSMRYVEKQLQLQRINGEGVDVEAYAEDEDPLLGILHSHLLAVLAALKEFSTCAFHEYEKLYKLAS